MNAGAVIVRRQNKYMRAFRQAGALAPDTARSLEELGLRESWVFRRMIVRGVFKSAGANRWYLDEFAASAFVRGRYLRIFGILIAFAVACLLYVILRR